MQGRIKALLLSYIGNISSGEDVDSFFMTYGSGKDLEMVSNLTQESINIMSAIENHLLDEDEMAVVREIIENAFARQNTRVERIR